MIKAAREKEIASRCRNVNTVEGARESGRESWNTFFRHEEAVTEHRPMQQAKPATEAAANALPAIKQDYQALGTLSG